MTFLKSQRSKFIAWMFIYALGVMLMFSKGGAEGSGFVWGLGVGAGAGIATSVGGPAGKWKRFLIVVTWFLGSMLLGMVILTDDFAPRQNLANWLVNLALGTLIAGLPALLALLIWIFRPPKNESAAAAAPSL
jgi:hypothetical protein